MQVSGGRGGRGPLVCALTVLPVTTASEHFVTDSGIVRPSLRGRGGGEAQRRLWQLRRRGQVAAAAGSSSAGKPQLRCRHPAAALPPPTPLRPYRVTASARGSSCRKSVPGAYSSNVRSEIGAPASIVRGLGGW